MPKGGCTCGKIRVEYDGEPAARVCTTIVALYVRTSTDPYLGTLPLRRLQEDERIRIQHQRHHSQLKLQNHLGHTQDMVEESRLRLRSQHLLLR
jgi:hypothetical protein